MSTSRSMFVALILLASCDGATTTHTSPVTTPTPHVAPSISGPIDGGVVDGGGDGSTGSTTPTTATATSPSTTSPCRSSAWASYGHDPARTSAGDGCVEGPLTVAWKMTRHGTCGFKFRPGRILHVIGDDTTLFASLDCGGAPALMRIGTEGGGEPLWTFGRGDYGRGLWPALAGDVIVSADDGVFLVDRETGKFRHHELDVWGEPIVVGESFFVANTFQLDSAGPFLGAIDSSLKWKWRAASFNPGKGKDVPRIGGTAFADDTIVYAATMGPRGIPSLSAHDARTGDQRWLAPKSFPVSAPSIGDGRVFTVEQWTGEKGNRLVARALSDGSVVWSQTTPWARGPSPVIVEKLAIVHGAEGVRAYDRETGTLAWSNPTPRKASSEEAATSMAAAKTSRTLVLTSGGRVVVLKLEDGTEQWSGTIVEGSSPTSFSGLVVGRPVVIGRSLYVTSDGTLFRLASATKTN